MKKITRILVALLTVTILLGVTACFPTSQQSGELEALQATVTQLQTENQDLKQQAIQAKEELANQKSALEALKQETDEKIKNLEAFIKGQYQIKVIDLDGEVLVDSFVYCRDSASVTETLTEQFDMVSYQSDYGTTIVSIASSIVDPNYYVSITENGKYAEVGVDGLVADAGDVFEFKVECWNTLASGYGTMDEYDLLVDKAIYGYLKNILPVQSMAETSWTGSLYWDQIATTFMAAHGYDANAFQLSYTALYEASVEATDVTTLSGTNLMKYYYAQKSLGNEIPEEFITKLHAEISTSCSDWLLPLAKALGVSTNGVTAAIAQAPSTSMEWGPDVSIWSYVQKGLYQDYDGYLSTYSSKLDWGNGTSTALVLLAFAKDGIDPRDTAYKKNGKDLIEVLFDTYYDADQNLIKVYATDTGTNYSTNQLYASLMAYKACRDMGTAVNIFA